jgi:group I intron endonuclease
MNYLKLQDKHTSGVYQIKNISNGRVYIGSTLKILTRYNAHKSQLKRGVHANTFLQNDWNKCGEEVFVFSVLEQVDDFDVLLRVEQKWLNKFYDNQQSCYNICKEAFGTRGYKHTQFSIDKMSRCKLGENNPSKRPEVKEKLSKLMTGKNNHQYGKKRPWAGIIGKQKCSKVVSQYHKNGSFIRRWESASEAARVLKLDSSNIRKCCQMKAISCGGFLWKFV